MPAIGSLSFRLKTIFGFRDFANFETILSAKKARAIAVLDQSARYTPVGSWDSSEEQIKLMLNYPGSSLDFGKKWKK